VLADPDHTSRFQAAPVVSAHILRGREPQPKTRERKHSCKCAPHFPAGTVKGLQPDADEAAYKHAGKQPKNPNSEGSNHAAVTFPLAATSAGRFSPLGIVFQILLGYGLTMFVRDPYDKPLAPEVPDFFKCIHCSSGLKRANPGSGS
jgi:hypothetical protein